MVKYLVVFKDFINFERIKQIFSQEEESPVVVLEASTINDDKELENYSNFLIPMDSNNNPMVDMKRFSTVTFGKLPSIFKSQLVGTLLSSPGANRFQRLHFYRTSGIGIKSDVLYDEIKKAVLNDEASIELRPWCENLLPFVERCDHPEILFRDSDCQMVFVKDRFPKGSLHFLCLPTKRIDIWAHLTPSDIPLLLKMKSEAELFSMRIIDSNSSNEVTFKFGFHVIPSMKQLHLHIVSDDFLDNPNLSAFQYNAFNSDFLVSVEDVIAELEAEGSIAMDEDRWEKYWNLLSGPLKCSHCERSFRSLERLKIHFKKEHHI